MVGLAGCFVDPGAGGGTGSGGATTTGDAAATSSTMTMTMVGSSTAEASTEVAGSTSTSAATSGPAETTGETGVVTTSGADGPSEGSSGGPETTGGVTLPGCDAAPSEGLLACYRFESIGLLGVLLDESPFSNHANGSNVNLVPGIAGMGLDMGVTSAVTAPSAEHLAPGQEMTYGGWVYPRTLPVGSARALLVDKNAQYGIILRASGASCGLPADPVYAPIEAGKWTHLACVHSANYDMTLYRDGVPIGTNMGKVLAGDSGAPLVIGNDSPTPKPEEAFDGVVDEVKIWGRALTTAEIAAQAGAP